jgi:hypothetical protein
VTIEGDSRHAAEAGPTDDDLTPRGAAGRRKATDRWSGGRRIRQGAEKQDRGHDRSGEACRCPMLGKAHSLPPRPPSSDAHALRSCSA